MLNRRSHELVLSVGHGSFILPWVIAQGCESQGPGTRIRHPRAAEAHSVNSGAGEGLLESTLVYVESRLLCNLLSEDK